MSEKQSGRSPGDRGWTPEQRKKQSEYMKKLHAEKRARTPSGALPEKSSGIERLTLGVMIKALQAYLELGADENTPIHFEETCVANQEIVGKSCFDPKSYKTAVECIIIR
jgi:hypothetical protein